MNDSLVVILILHIRDVIIIIDDLPIAHITGVVHRSYLAHLQRLTARQTTGTQPAIVIAARLAAPEIFAILDNRLLVAGITRKVRVQSSMARHIARHQELFTGGQVGRA